MDCEECPIENTTCLVCKECCPYETYEAVATELERLNLVKKYDDILFEFLETMREFVDNHTVAGAHNYLERLDSFLIRIRMKK